jgi:hypothetical protein
MFKVCRIGILDMIGSGWIENPRPETWTQSLVDPVQRMFTRQRRSCYRSRDWERDIKSIAAARVSLNEKLLSVL